MTFESHSGERDLDFVLSLLSERRARFVSYYLLSDDIDEINDLFLARQVAAWEAGVDPSQVSAAQATHILDTLRDELLPPLAEIGLVTYDSGTGTVHADRSSNQYVRLLRFLQSIERPKQPG